MDRKARGKKRNIRPTTQRSPVPDGIRSCRRRRRSLTTPEQVETSACTAELRCVPCARCIAIRCRGVGTTIFDEVIAICQSKRKKAGQRKVQDVKGKNRITSESKHGTKGQRLSRDRNNDTKAQK